MKETNFENITLPENEQESSFDFKSEFFNIIYHWKLFAIFIIACSAVAFLYLRYTKPIYKITCSVLIKDDPKSKLANDNVMQQLDAFKQQSNVQNEIGIIQSKSLSRKTVCDLNLFISYFQFTNKLNRKVEIYDDCPYKIVIDTNHVQLLYTPINITFVSKDKIQINIKDYDKAYPYSFLKANNDLPVDISKAQVNTTVKLNEQFKNASFSFKVIKNPDFKNTSYINKNYCFEIYDPYAIGGNYSGMIQAERIDKDASIVEISMKTSLPAKSLQFLRALQQNYINIDLEYKNLTAINTIKFIDSQLEQITDSLHNVEDILEQFRIKNKTIDMPAEYQAVITKIEALDDEKVKNNIELKYYDYMLNYLQKNKDYTDIISPALVGIQDATLTSLVTDIVTLAEEKSKLKISTTENNPYFATVESNLSSTKKALIEQIKNSFSLAQISQKDINKRVSESEEYVSKLPGTAKDLFTIQRKFNLSDQTYNFLLEKKAESSISKASNLSNNLILDPPEVAGKVYPKNTMVYMICLLLGLLLPYVIIKLREYLNDTLQTKKDIESQTNLTIIGTIAHNRHDITNILVEKPRSMVSETIRSVKANMDFVCAKGSNIVLLTSTIGGEGKTFSSINISSAFAISDKKTILIGADLRKPKIFNDFNLTNEKGLTTYLIDKCELNEIINETHIPNLHIITAGPVPPNPAELLSGEKIKALLSQLREMYDFIVIDTPPIGIVTDALFLMKYADVNIYVTRCNYTSKKVIKDVNDIVKTTGIKNVCILFNDVSYNEGSYGRYGRYGKYGRYGYGKYGYGRKYGYGYGYGYGNYGSGYYEN